MNCAAKSSVESGASGYPRAKPLSDAVICPPREVRKTLSSPWVSRFRCSPVSTRGGAGSSRRWGGLALAVAVWALTIPTAALALPLTHEGFDYSAGSLEGGNGGTGDWKDQWSGNSDIVIVAPGGLC